MALARRSGARMAGTVAAALLVAAPLTSCSGDDESGAADETASASPSASPEESSSAPSPAGDASSASPKQTQAPDAGIVLDVRVRGDDVQPLAKRVQVAAGEPVEIDIDSDTAGELHVHSTPEDEVEFGAGKTSEQLVLDQPGIVEVELHEPTEVTVFQLEVR